MKNILLFIFLFFCSVIFSNDRYESVEISFEENPTSWKKIPSEVEFSYEEKTGVFWQKIIFKKKEVERPYLLFMAVNESLSVYFEGKEIFKFGGKDEFHGYPFLLVPLPEKYWESPLLFKYYSNHVNIGPVGEILLDSFENHFLYLFNQNIFKIISGICTVFLGFCLLLFCSIKTPLRSQIFLLSIFSINIGIYTLLRTHVKYFILNIPVVYVYLEIYTFYFSILFIILFLKCVFRDLRIFLSFIAYYFLSFILGSFLLILGGKVSLMAPLFYFQISVAFWFFIIILVFLWKRPGGYESWMVIGAWIAVGVGGVFEIFVAMNLIFKHLNGKTLFLPISVVLMISIFTSILILRIIQVYKTNASLSLSQAMIESEMKTAAALQSALIPPDGIHQGKFGKLWTFYLPAENTGGDWLGFYEMKNSSVTSFFVGDVTGHGVPSALLTGVIHGAVMALLREYDTHDINIENIIKKICNQTNRLVKECGIDLRYMSLFVGFFNWNSRKLFFVSAGHPPAYLISSLKVTPLFSHSSILGMGQEDSWNIKEVLLEEKALICVYSDGLIENTWKSLQRNWNTREFTKWLRPLENIEQFDEKWKDKFNHDSMSRDDDSSVFVFQI